MSRPPRVISFITRKSDKRFLVVAVRHKNGSTVIQFPGGTVTRQDEAPLDFLTRDIHKTFRLSLQDIHELPLLVVPFRGHVVNGKEEVFYLFRATTEDEVFMRQRDRDYYEPFWVHEEAIGSLEKKDGHSLGRGFLDALDTFLGRM